MATKVLSRAISPVSSVVPLLRTASVNGSAADLAGYESAAVVFHCGANTDGTHTPVVEESDASGSGFAAVAAADLDGTLVALVANSVQQVGYKGHKRYIRAVVTVTGSPSTGAASAAVIQRGGKHATP